jgi:hypothetical protein
MIIRQIYNRINHKTLATRTIFLFFYRKLTTTVNTRNIIRDYFIQPILFVININISSTK